MSWTKLCGGMLLLALAATCGCTTDENPVAVGETHRESQVVALGAAKSVRVDLIMKVGELKVRGGSSNLLDAAFTYNVAEWKPKVRYDVSGGVGHLVVEQPGSSTSTGDTRNEWDLHFNDSTPKEMTINMGAGRSTLSLARLALSRVDLNMGVGDATVDLTGAWKNDLSAQIHGGVGRATIRLPRDVGVHVVAHGGIGAIKASGFRQQGDAYVNDQYGKTPVTLHVEVEGGIGEIQLKLAGEPPAA